MCRSVSSFDDKNARKMAHHHLIDAKEGRYFLCFLADTNHTIKYEEIALLGFHANCRKKTLTLQWCSAKVFLAQQQQHMQEDHEEMWHFIEIVDFECAEIIGGVLLGPTAFGRIPGFTAAIFPESSLTVLNTFANIGLIFFLFLVGLELDLQSLRKYAVFSTPFFLGFSSSITSLRFIFTTTFLFLFFSLT
jgi:hypothetical protein